MTKGGMSIELNIDRCENEGQRRTSTSNRIKTNLGENVETPGEGRALAWSCVPSIVRQFEGESPLPNLMEVKG